MSKNVGILIIATNKYVDYLPNLLSSMEKYFLNGHKKTYYVFTNQKEIAYAGKAKIKIIPIEHAPWPGMTLMRFGIFDSHKEMFEQEDYLYYIDADMRVLSPIGNEIFGEIMATRHYGFIRRPKTAFPYETNMNSTAFVPSNRGTNYYAGAFQGGERLSYLKAVGEMAKNIDDDLNKNIIARWHDESHWNRYLAFNPPTTTLDENYCVYEACRQFFQPKILSVAKVEAEVRT